MRGQLHRAKFSHTGRTARKGRSFGLLYDNSGSRHAIKSDKLSSRVRLSQEQDDAGE